MVGNIWAQIQEFDESLFHLINEKWANPWLDLILPWTREKLIWVPLYVVLVFYWVRKYKMQGFYWVLILAALVGLSDLISAHFIKIYVHRLRPCQNLHWLHPIISRIPCGTGFSFVSSHASNHFTIAAFTAIGFRKRLSWLEPCLYLWAGLISYAQVYVGVHYPLDVLSGALLGLVIGWTGAYFTWRHYPSQELTS